MRLNVLEHLEKLLTKNLISLDRALTLWRCLNSFGTEAERSRAATREKRLVRAAKPNTASRPLLKPTAMTPKDQISISKFVTNYLKALQIVDDDVASRALLLSVLLGSTDEARLAKLGLDPKPLSQVAGRFRKNGVWRHDGIEPINHVVEFMHTAMVGRGHARRINI